ncbi:MAG: sigma-70 factor domain-containing protein, partial [Kiloniellales bacterium]|nr:sigma-70 factor domain-containing protein [Kiloniellales bacterium]
MTTTKIPALVSEGNLNSYLQEIRKFPMLEQDEEFMLAKAWREKGDT